MSYILEALRKSEQERARGREQDLLRFPVATPPESRTLRPGVVLGLSALLLAGGVAIGWWKPWERAAAPAQEAAPPAPPKAAEAPLPLATAPAAAPTRAEALKELQPLLPGASTAPAASPSAAPPKPEPPPAAAPAAMAPVLPEVKPPPSPAAKVEDKKPAAKPPPPKELPPPPNRVLALAELPPVVREALPPIAVRGFVHSEDARSRMVVINDRMLQEGDEVAADLRLERIDPDGIVLNYKGYRFIAPK